MEPRALACGLSREVGSAHVRVTREVRPDSDRWQNVDQQVRLISEGWLQIYNDERPRLALGRLPPVSFAERQLKLENSSGVHLTGNTTRSP
jgi:transposase InsO family protein